MNWFPNNLLCDGGPVVQQPLVSVQQRALQMGINKWLHSNRSQAAHAPRYRWCRWKSTPLWRRSTSALPAKKMNIRVRAQI